MKDDIVDIFMIFDNKCAFCGSEENLEIDHVIPISRSDIENPGTVRGNLMPLCRSCNASKRDRTLEEYLMDPVIILPEIRLALEEKRKDCSWLIAEVKFKLSQTVRMVPSTEE